MLEMRVAKNRETIRGMNVRILSGLRLEVQADPTDQGRYTLKTAYSQLLRSKYQVCIHTYDVVASKVWQKVIYDRIWNRENNFEMSAFFNLERGTLNIWNSCCKVYKQYFEFSCYWYSSFYGREFQNNFACCVPYDI